MSSPHENDDQGILDDTGDYQTEEMVAEGPTVVGWAPFGVNITQKGDMHFPHPRVELSDET